jgi:Domain of unknown function (DUF4430)
MGCAPSTTQKPSSTQGTAPAQVTRGTVTIVIDDGNEVVEQKIENVTAGTTVEQLMKQLDDPTVKISGTGTTALVTAIRGKTNSGGEGWTYRVNDEWADRGIGTFELTPPATIRWKHGDLSEMQE